MKNRRGKMEEMELGRLTADDLSAIAGNRLNRKKYTKWTAIGGALLITWVVIVALFTVAIEEEEDGPEYKVYEIREHIVVFDQFPPELPTNELRLYTDGDLEYMDVRYAPSYTENYGDRDDWVLPIVVMVIPFIAWIITMFYFMYHFEKEKRDFVDANCEVTIA